MKDFIKKYTDSALSINTLGMQREFPVHVSFARIPSTKVSRKYCVHYRIATIFLLISCCNIQNPANRSQMFFLITHNVSIEMEEFKDLEQMYQINKQRGDGQPLGRCRSNAYPFTNHDVWRFDCSCAYGKEYG